MKLSTLEKKYHFIIINKNGDEDITEKEFLALDLADKYGVNHDDRIKFLKDNGYDITRENMVNPDLSARQED